MTPRISRPICRTAEIKLWAALIVVVLAASATASTSAARPLLAAPPQPTDTPSAMSTAQAAVSGTATPSERVYLPLVLVNLAPEPTRTPTPTGTAPAGAYDAFVRIDHEPGALDTQPSLAVGPDGKVHIAYMHTYGEGGPPSSAVDILYRTNAAGSFSTPQTITVPTLYASFQPCIAVDRGGTVHIVFGRKRSSTSYPDDEIYYVNNRNGRFENPTIIVKGDIRGSITFPQAPIIRIDTNGVLHVAFQAVGGYWNGLYYMNNAKGSFGTPIPVARSLGTIHNFTMALDSLGRPHFAIAGSWKLYVTADIFYVKATGDPYVDPAFSFPVDAAHWPRDPSDFWPGLDVDAGGAAHIAFRDAFGTRGLWYVNNHDGEFGEPIMLPGQFWPWLQVDPQGGVHIAYKGCSTCLGYSNNRSGGFVEVGGAPSDPASWVWNFGRHFLEIGPGNEFHLVLSAYPIMLPPPPGPPGTLFYVHGTYASGPVPTPTPSPTPSPTPQQGWRIEMVDGSRDGSKDVGRNASLAFDREGKPHIAYLDFLQGKLKYATRDGAGWRIETIAGASDASDQAISLALDANSQPHIGYISGQGVKYAYRDGEGWHYEDVGTEVGAKIASECALALDSQGRPYIVSARTGYSDSEGVWVSWKDSTGWHSEIAERARNRLGGYVSIKLDAADRPHITYQYHGGTLVAGDDYLKYAFRDGTGWHVETVDAKPGAGAYNSLSLDASGYPHIAYYYDYTEHYLKYATKDSSGWHLETVHKGWMGDFGQYSSLVLDTQGRAHISYYEAKPNSTHWGRLWYAYQDGTGWRKEIVADSYWEDLGLYSSLALDADGKPAIAYYRNSYNQLMYAGFH